MKSILNYSCRCSQKGLIGVFTDNKTLDEKPRPLNIRKVN